MLKLLYNRLALAALITATLLPPVNARQQNAPRSSRVGPYTVSSFAQIEGSQTDTGGWEGTVTSRGTRPIQITSDQYNLTAMHIDMAMAYVNRTLKPTNVTATGKIKIVVVNAVTKQKSIATCNKVVFTATKDPKDRGKIKLLGNVHIETPQEGFDGPIDLQGDTGEIEFLPGGRLHFSVASDSGNGTLQGTPIEPAPKGKP